MTVSLLALTRAIANWPVLTTERPADQLVFNLKADNRYIVIEQQILVSGGDSCPFFEKILEIQRSVRE
jgi:hypothetical protein